MPLTKETAAAIALAVTVLLGLLLTVVPGPATAHDKKWCARDPLGKVHCANTKKKAVKKACALSTPLHPCSLPWRHRH